MSQETSAALEDSMSTLVARKVEVKERFRGQITLVQDFFCMGSKPR